MSIQYYCHEETVLQTYLISLRDIGTSDSKLGSTSRAIRLATDFIIRGLDFTKRYRQEDEHTYQREHDLHLVDNKTVVILHTMANPDSDDHNEEYSSDGESNNDSDVTAQHPSEEPKSAPQATAAFLISTFVNGDPATINNDEAGSYVNIPDSRTADQVEITVAYTLRILDEEMSDSLGCLARNSSDYNDLLRQISLESSKSSLEAARLGNEDDVMGTVPPKVPNMTGTENEDVERNQGSKQQPSSHAAQAMTKAASELSDSSPFRRICFDKDDKLDLMFRRNLEHILSVCCIPVPSLATSSDIRDSPTAITCGDISGHRVGPRASLCVYHRKALILQH